MLMSQFEVESRLKPYEGSLCQCINDAWNVYQQYPHRQVHSPTTRANIVHNHIFDNAGKVFADDPAVKILDLSGLRLINICNQISIKFKKLDIDWNSSNVQTEQTKLYHSQGELPGIPPAINLIVGYQLDSTQTEVKSIAVSCPNGRGNAWTYTIDIANEDREDVLMPQIDTEEISERRVIPRKDIRRKHG